MKASKIKMKPGCYTSNNLVEIDEIFITGCDKEGFFKKEVLHDYLLKNLCSIQVNIAPFPDLFPVVSSNNEKYVRSEPNSTTRDNLLSLPRT